jgi:hypothetical protein
MAGYKNLADEGRGGDALLRVINGELSHVNAFEAYLVDNYGPRGEGVVQRMGSGTVNPKTGLREYAFDPNKLYEEDYSENRQFRPSQGVWGILGQSRKAKLRRSAGASMLRGMDSLQDQLDTGRESITGEYVSQMGNLSGQALQSTQATESAMAQSGLETSGKIMGAQQQTMSGLDAQAANIGMQSHQARMDLQSDIQAQYEALLSQYETTAEREFKGDLSGYSDIRGS